MSHSLIPEEHIMFDPRHTVERHGTTWAVIAPGRITVGSGTTQDEAAAEAARLDEVVAARKAAEGRS